MFMTGLSFRVRCERIVTKIKTHKPSHRRYRAPRLDIHDATAAASDDEAAPAAPAADEDAAPAALDLEA